MDFSGICAILDIRVLGTFDHFTVGDVTLLKLFIHIFMSLLAQFFPTLYCEDAAFAFAREGIMENRSGLRSPGI